MAEAPRMHACILMHRDVDVKADLVGCLRCARSPAEWARSAAGGRGAGGRGRGAGRSAQGTYTHGTTTVSSWLAFLSQSVLGCGGCRALREGSPQCASQRAAHAPVSPRSAQSSQRWWSASTSLLVVGLVLGHG
jgi:hypothetical protein